MKKNTGSDYDNSCANRVVSIESLLPAALLCSVSTAVLKVCFQGYIVEVRNTKIMNTLEMFVSCGSYQCGTTPCCVVATFYFGLLYLYYTVAV